jgi:hypothetical protein
MARDDREPKGSGPGGTASRDTSRRPDSADRASGRKPDTTDTDVAEDIPARKQTPFPGDDAGRPPSPYPTQMDR